MIETESDETLFIYIYLYDQDKRSLDKSELLSSKTQSVGHMFLAPGEYYVKAVPKSKSSGAYTITSTFAASLYVNENDYDREPNNIQQHAQLIKLETTYTGHIGYYNSGSYDRTDYYRFADEVTRNVYIKAVGESSLDIEIEFIDVCGCGSGEPIVLLETVGDHVWFYTYTRDCYIKITSRSESHGSYALIITDIANRSPPPRNFYINYS